MFYGASVLTSAQEIFNYNRNIIKLNFGISDHLAVFATANANKVSDF